MIMPNGLPLALWWCVLGVAAACLYLGTRKPRLHKFSKQELTQMETLSNEKHLDTLTLSEIQRLERIAHMDRQRSVEIAELEQERLEQEQRTTTPAIWKDGHPPETWTEDAV